MTRLDIYNALLAEDSPKELFGRADAERRSACGDPVVIRGLVEFSSQCVRCCQYCGLRRDNLQLDRYRMTLTEMIATAQRILDAGIRTVIFQSGDDLTFTREDISLVLRAVKKRMPEAAVTLSLGERPSDDYQAFFDNGADRYLLKFETANPSLYRKLHPGQSLKKRVELLEDLRRIGYQVGTGNIIGLPGQTMADLAHDLEYLKEFQPDMIGVGPFIPQQQTPLAGHPMPGPELVLKVLALARILVPTAHIPATTALATLGGHELQARALQCGANVLMVNFSPSEYKGLYRLYDHKACVDFEKAKDIAALVKRPLSLARHDTLSGAVCRSS
ncbi:MAG: [FeFe] hydrogenase H-cluster radical SAM maturase HydE [Candidatus Omnitrophota bacterium]|jgi:biotin synthase